MGSWASAQGDRASDGGRPAETLLTIDATTGQNGLRQAQLFAQTAQVSGVV